MYFINIVEKQWDYQKDSDFEGFSKEGGIIKFREAVQQDIVIETIEKSEEWKNEQLTKTEVEILKYVVNFGKRINK